jgi:hypothetical protein
MTVTVPETRFFRELPSKHDDMYCDIGGSRFT